MKISITFQVVTHESAEKGDASENGYLVESVDCSDVADALDEIENSLGCLPYCEASSSTLDENSYFTEIDGETDIYDGSCTSHSIHFEGATLAELKEIASALHCK